MTARTSRRSRAAAASVLAITCAVLPVSAEAGASSAERGRGKADLVVQKVTLDRQVATVGEELPVHLVVRNRGTRRSPKTSASFLLSTDRSVSGNDVALPVVAAVPRIRPGAKKKVSTTLTVPTGVSGARHVIACVAKVRGEKRRTAQNNCRAVKEILEIGAVTDDELPAYYVGTSTASHVYTVTTTATDSFGATWTQEDRDLTATDVVLERRTRQDGSAWYVAVSGEVEWAMGGGHVWPDETCDYSGRGTVPIGARPAGTPYFLASIVPSGSGMGPGAGYVLDDHHYYNGGRAPTFALDCTALDQTRNYLVDPWLTVLTSAGDESATCEWAIEEVRFNVAPSGSLTGENSCRRDTSRTLPNGSDHEYTFTSSVSWNLEPADELPSH